jgi:hypothetical protein
MRECEQMSRFANLADKTKASPKSQPQPAVTGIDDGITAS